MLDALPITPQFDLTDKQKEVRAVFATGAKYFLVYGGSRSGKTFFIIYAIIVRMLKAPGSRHVVFRQDGVDAKQSIGNETVPAVLELAFPGLELKWKDKDGYFEAPNGSQLWLAGLKDKARLDKVLGREFATVYLNEASIIAFPSFQVVETRLAQTVMCLPVGDAAPRRLSLKFYVDLNPTTDAHWTYQQWVKGVRPDDGTPLPDHETMYRYIMVNPMDNQANLDPSYLRSLENMSEAMKKRFFDGLYTGDDPNALWQRKFIKIHPSDVIPPMQRVVVAVDPAISKEVGSDETGIVVAGEGMDGMGYVIADESGKLRPEEWARRAISLYDTYDADCIVAEVNQGGDMVEATIKAQAKNRVIPYRGVHATKGKRMRAEPIAALYEQNKVIHMEDFPRLVDQMCVFTIDFDRKLEGYSPDRLDAAVWALTDLFPRLVQKNSGPPAAPPPQRTMPMAGRR